jgi:Predicted signal transduction protein with a C-terminal ATPase domain
MRFQTKLMLSYSLIIVVLAIALGIGFYSYSAGVFERSARESLASVSDRMARQLDDLVKPMDFVTTYLLSDGDFLSAMASMAYLDRSDQKSLIYVNEGWRKVKSSIRNYSMQSNFRAVNVFNHAGDYLSSNLADFAGRSDSRPEVELLPWLGRVDAAAGKAVLLPSYGNPWTSGGAKVALVYGLARAVQGPKGPEGYIEVQNDAAELDRLFSLPGRGIRVLAFLEDGLPFYGASAREAALRGEAAPSASELARYGELARRAAVTGGALASRDPDARREEIAAAAEAAYAGAIVLLVQDKAALLAPLAFIRNIVLLVGLLIIVVSLAYNYLFSRQLSRPIRGLKERMEGTELGNLPEALALESSNDEIAALNAAFLALRSRLADSVHRELESQSLEARARFDSLQAQVSPHFIYNVLTVIANKGLEAGSDEIGEICGGLASMLRYSTSTKTRYATLDEELEHVRSYLFLMKKRLEHRLEFSVEAAPSILGERLPKIVFQQLAENSISHGYGEGLKSLRVDVRGRVEGGRWRVEVSDDGIGFAPDVLARLQGSIDGIRHGARSAEGTEIGGMGLANLCSRLALFYGGDFDFEIGNSRTGGAIVSVGARLGSPRGAPAGLGIEDR